MNRSHHSSQLAHFKRQVLDSNWIKSRNPKTQPQKTIRFHRLNRFLRLKMLWGLLAVVLTACGQNLVEPSGDRLGELQGKLSLWHPFERENAEIFDGFLNNFLQLHPEIDLVSESIPPSQIMGRFTQQQNAGLGPTVMVAFARQIPEMVKKKQIQAIDNNALNFSDFLPPTRFQAQYRRQIYGIPLASNLRVLCYNPAKLNNQAKKSKKEDKASIQPPKTLAELVERSRQGYTVGMVSSFEDTFWGMGSFGGKFFDAQGLVTPQLQGWEKWLQWVKQAQNEPNIVLLRNRDLLHRAFAQGKLTYYVCDSTEISSLKNELHGKLGIAPLPGELNHPATPLLYTRVLVLNRSASPHEAQLALQLAKFMTNPEQQVKGVVASQTFIPTHHQAKFNAHLFPIEAVLIKQSQSAVTLPTNAIAQITPIFEQGELLYQQAIAGEITPSQAVLRLTKTINQQIYQNVKE